MYICIKLSEQNEETQSTSHRYQLVTYNSVTSSFQLDYKQLTANLLSFQNKQGAAFKRELANAVNLLEGNIEHFPIYRESEAYQVKHFEHYKNEKDDSCYFFG